MYGVISSTTRKIKKLYGSIGSTTKKIKKVYGVVGGVTRLIYTVSSVNYPLEFLQMASTHGEASQCVKNGATLEGTFSTMNLYLTARCSTYSGITSYIVLPEIDGGYDYLIGRTISITESCGYSSTSATMWVARCILGTNNSESQEDDHTNGATNKTYSWSISSVKDTVKVGLCFGPGIYGSIKSLKVS